MTWFSLASSKESFKLLLSSGKELLHNEVHSTSRITQQLIVQLAISKQLAGLLAWMLHNTSVSVIDYTSEGGWLYAVYS